MVFFKWFAHFTDFSKKDFLKFPHSLHRKSMVDESWKLRDFFLQPLLNQLETGRLQTLFFFLNAYKVNELKEQSSILLRLIWKRTGEEKIPH